MAKALYLVIQSQGKWWVDFEGVSRGPFDRREVAALQARAMALDAPPAGREAQVLVPDAEGRYWIIWTSSHDSAQGSFVPQRVG